MKKIFLILFILPYIGISQINFASNNSFDVMTWNLEWFPKHGSTTIDSIKSIVEIIDADIIALQEINNTYEFNQLANILDSYSGYSTNSSNLNLAFLYKKTLEVDSIYTILHSAEYLFAGRLPLVIETKYGNEEYVVINNHFKCCGDGVLAYNVTNDEEYRRFRAVSLLKQYIDSNYTTKNVIILGDLNDLVEENYVNNVFNPIINDSIHYLIADKYIPSQNTANWSYPSWPSHLDHIIINNNLFDNLIDIHQDVKTIRVDSYLGSFQTYDNIISDHLPVGINLFHSPTMINDNTIKSQKPNIIYNILGQLTDPKNNSLFIELYNDGTIEKKIIIE